MSQHFILYHILPSLLHYLSYTIISSPPSPTLYPYTTLFRSCPPCARTPRCSGPGAPLPRPRPGRPAHRAAAAARSEEHTSELQSRGHLVCRLLLEKKNKI